MIKFTCPQCGAKREHHRTYLNTTEKEKFFERNPNKTADESIKYLIGYTHHYHSSFVCPECGETMESNTTDGGGCVTIYYSDRRKDTRTPPSEF